MKCIVDGCVNDARFNSSYCEECWECIVADAKASFYCAEPGFYDYDDNPGEGDNDGALASIYREVQAIKEMACDEIMRGKIERRRLERENVTLLNACLSSLGQQVVGAFRAALGGVGLHAPFYLTQNDGTVMLAEAAARALEGGCAACQVPDASVIVRKWLGTIEDLEAPSLGKAVAAKKQV